ncbi:MAG: prolyl aminopeptidase [Candidatus Microgenomates bacterium]
MNNTKGLTPKPFKEWFLPEKDGHTVAVYEYGNPDGAAVLVSHGGPGDKSKPKHVTGFDLSCTHVITFDQRGCGKSLPAGKTDHNTTQDTIADMERIRETLGLDSWYVSGGSWGSTLSLVYAQSNPRRVKGLMLTSIFLADIASEDWAFAKTGGAEALFPDAWQHREDFFKKYQTSSQGYAKKLLALLKDAQDQQTRIITAGILNWESNLMTYETDLTYYSPDDIVDGDVNTVKIMLHYESNNYFLTDNQILANLQSISAIPTLIVHGRYDILCPIKQAWQIHQNIQNSELVILPSSGHRLTAEGSLARGLAYQKFLISNN